MQGNKIESLASAIALAIISSQLAVVLFKPGRPARTWFLEIAFVQEVGMRTCVRPQAIKNYSCGMKAE